MKKLLVLGVLAFLFGGLLPAEKAQAASAGTYTFADFELEITAPEGLTVFLPDTIDSDPDVGALGFDGESMKKTLKQAKIDLDAVGPGATWEITLGMEDGVDGISIFDLNLYNDDYLYKIGEDLSDRYARNRIKQTSIEIRQGEQARFLVSDMVQNRSQGNIYRRQYYTIYNGRILNLVLISLGEAPTEEMKKILDEMAESIHFTQTLPVPEAVAKQVNKLNESGEIPNDILNSTKESDGFLFLLLGVTVFIVAWILKKTKE